MNTVTVIIHGWSDCSASFQDLKQNLINQGLGTVKTILYADYESREDNMTFEDIVDGLNDQFIKEGLINTDGKKLADMNIVCHSTGGLVIRHWIWRYYGDEGTKFSDCPVKRIVMLAPANFGSHLAQQGKSFFGSLIKGRLTFGNFFETGRQILNGLELGSPYQWNLAHRDLIVENPYYNARQIQLSVMVGCEGFGGIASLANRPGTDGTVLIPGTSLDSAKLTLDFSKPHDKDQQEEYCPFDWAVTNPKDDFAFAVLEGLNHGSIVSASADPSAQVGKLVAEALEVNTPAAFRKFQDKLEKITDATYQNTGQPKYQQFLVHALDDQDIEVKDFTLDFFIWKAAKGGTGEIVTKEQLSKDELAFSMKASDLLSKSFHTHTVDSSYRSFLVNLREIEDLVADAKTAMGTETALSMKMYVPDIDSGIHYDTSTLQNIILYSTAGQDKNLPSFFYPNTTTLLELRVNRYNTYVTVGPDPVKH